MWQITHVRVIEHTNETTQYKCSVYTYLFGPPVVPFNEVLLKNEI